MEWNGMEGGSEPPEEVTNTEHIVPGQCLQEVVLTRIRISTRMPCSDMA